MNITNLTIKNFSKGSFNCTDMENVRHTKVLSMISVVQSTEGHYSIGLDGSPLKNTAEGGFLIAPAFANQEIIHYENPKTKRMCARWVFIDAVVNDQYVLDSLFSFPTVTSDDVSNNLNAVFEELFETNDIISNKISCYKIVKILLSIAKPKENTNPHLNKAISFLSDNFKNSLSVNDIASYVGISPSRLYEVFKTYVGSSPVAYLNGLRLSHGAFLLQNTKKPISEIAEECGIPDAFYFSKLFKAAYGASPKNYRTQNAEFSDKRFCC